NGKKADIKNYISTNPQILKEIQQIIIAKELKPVNLISYERMPLISVEDGSLRITFDFNIRSRADDLDLTHGTDGESRCPKNVAVLELKTNKPIPLWMTKILAKYNYRNQMFSKYCLHYSPIRILSAIKSNDEGDNNNDKRIHKKLN
ncbi:MAG: VTC domain-containing protein, partial [Clostridia bacterium]|nr:VTC domain-containing protein [Clostridia bacterium]